VWDRAQRLGVDGAFVPGVSPAQWRRVARQLAGLPGLCWGVGLHPYHLEESTPAHWRQALDSLPQCYRQLGACAVGECGLDARLAKRGGPDLEVQVGVLEAHLDIARLLGAPIVVHVVGAHGRMLQLLERRGPLPAGGILHSYSGSAELVPRYARLGFSFGFGGAVVSDRARRARDSVRRVEPQQLLLETDAPDQPIGGGGPGRRNEPAALLQVAETVASLRNIPLDALAESTRANALRLFGVGMAAA